MVFIPRPNNEQVKTYLQKWDALENYTLQEKALDKLFHELCPENRRIEDVLLKCAALNDFYSTNIFSIYPVAKHIAELNIDDRLVAGDLTLVQDIQNVSIGGKEKHFYSFATKYCSHHNDKAYPICDSYVKKVLKHFRKVDGFVPFKNQDLEDYISFYTILESFREFYHLEDFSLKEIDKYLWLFGKEYFPNKY